MPNPVHIAAFFLLVLAPRPADPPPPTVPTWTFIYVMSYDNDLSPLGPGILAALEKGVSEGIAVTVLADFRESGGLHRIAIDANGRQDEIIKSENSASEEVLGAYLKWAMERFPASSYAIVFLDHGGALDEMALDESTGSGDPKKWLSAKAVGPLIRELQTKERRIELLFLQQCGRGSIENLYNFRGSATAILASQTYVGAPNTYYTPTLKWLADHCDATGVEVARRIATSDDDFTSYVCVSGARLEQLPSRIDPVIDELVATDRHALPADRMAARCFGPRRDESLCDLLGWLNAAYEARAIRVTRESAFVAFDDWIRSELIAFQQRHSDRLLVTRNWCGLGLWVPESRDAFLRYVDYPLYRDSKLDEIWSKADWTTR